jgi:hypothetical protein
MLRNMNNLQYLNLSNLIGNVKWEAIFDAIKKKSFQTLKQIDFSGNIFNLKKNPAGSELPTLIFQCNALKELNLSSMFVNSILSI